MEHNKYKELITDLVFGELDEKLKVELNEHLKKCFECREELTEINHLKTILNKSDTEEVNEKLLSEARFQFKGALRVERQRDSLWDKIKDTELNYFSFNYKFALSGVALLLVGFITGYLIFNSEIKQLKYNLTTNQNEFVLNQNDVKIQNIRFINQDPATGEVEFVVDAVKPITVKGNVKDNEIKNLLTYAILNEQNPGTRLNTINLMSKKSGTNDEEIKTALITVMKYDSIPGVRREAIKTLRSYSFDLEIKNALLYVLMNDDNASLRIEAINSLTKAQKEGSTFNQEDLSIFKEKMHADKNNYVRFQAKNVLKEKN